MCSIAATTALFSTAFFMAKRFDAQGDSGAPGDQAWRARRSAAMKPAFAGDVDDLRRTSPEIDLGSSAR